MASIFSTPDEARCRHYARFAAHLDRKHFDIIYWLLFLLVITMLCCASAQYMRMLEMLEGLPPRGKTYKATLYRCMMYCGAYTAVSIVAVVLEVFVLMALQFCDGEDLMSIYWSTWTMLQVGSLIAVMGILLHVFHMLRGRKHPPWALALGTPVLVVAGIGQLIHTSLWRRIKRLRIWFYLGFKSDKAMSISDTIRVGDSDAEKRETEDWQYTARLIGFTPDGGPILQFTEARPLPTLPENVTILGTDDRGCVTIIIRKNMTIVKDSTSHPPKHDDKSQKPTSDPEKLTSMTKVHSMVSAVSSVPTATAAAAFKIQQPAPVYVPPARESHVTPASTRESSSSTETSRDGSTAPRPTLSFSQPTLPLPGQDEGREPLSRRGSGVWNDIIRGRTDD